MARAPITVNSDKVKRTCVPIVRDFEMDEETMMSVPSVECGYTYAAWRRHDGAVVLYPYGMRQIMIVDGPIITTASVEFCSDCGNTEGNMYRCKDTGDAFCDECINENATHYSVIPMLDGE
jgi:hypothetical protein